MQTDRIKSDPLLPTLYAQFEEYDRRTVDEVRAIAEARGISRAQVALTWVMHRPAVASPTVGATRLSHLDDAVAAVELELDEHENTRLEQHYVPHAIEGFA